MFLEVGRPESVGDTVASLTMCGSVSCRVPGAGEGEGQPGSPRQGAELCLSSLLLMSDLLTGSQGRGRGDSWSAFWGAAPKTPLLCQDRDAGTCVSRGLSHYL